MRKLRVFLCHSSGDKPAVRYLYYRLCEENIEPWLDEENLLPGQDWIEEISNKRLQKGKHNLFQLKK